MKFISREATARSRIGSRLRTLAGQFELLRRYGAKLGPYVLLEVLLPGGTLFALLLFLYQRRKLNPGSLRLLSTLGEERGWNAPLGIVRSAQ